MLFVAAENMITQIKQYFRKRNFEAGDKWYDNRPESVLVNED